MLEKMPKSAMIRLPGIQTVRKLTASPLLLGLCHRWLDCSGNASGDFVLNRKYVGQTAVIALGPHVRARCCLDELGRDAHAIARFAHAPLEDVTHTQFAADLLDIDRAALVGEAGVARDDEEPARF
jgi:hypothetical protein